ncbi:MAG: hypothetical protein Kow0092_40200 [Deferrisomatales bacterium]
MARPPWEKLVRELTDSGYESPYLDRLRTRIDVGRAHDELRAEILREMASALGRAEDKVNLALLRLELIGRELDDLLAEEGRDQGWARRTNARVEAFNRQRAQAQRCLWELVIHREALGFRRNSVLREFYPIPPKRAPVRPRGGPGGRQGSG